ncbi:kinase-like protein [Mollisia scopiformis]|uniref:non-specific serine/threonine protein kinase n=1 Tax=Mollisia scopiformis TaxID=149040 RepID=A0A194XCV1_MOLSC|nr:kinase-like protein [Mollisia scopiformis]KUJ17998.1 kinase-like protein [Mollisia scopiformis]
MPSNFEEQQAWRKALPAEFAKLPQTWGIRWKKERSGDYIEYYNLETGVSTTTHPNLGPLPKNWTVRLCTMTKTGRRVPRYFNKRSRKFYVADPRLRPESIKADNTSVSKFHKSNDIAQNNIFDVIGLKRKLVKGDKIQDFRRAEIGQKDISDAYEYLHAIDAGGEIGGMNGGVYVVRLKGAPTLFVEKRFLTGATNFKMAQNEIKLMHRVIHGALTFYINGFITPTKCAVWMEFCDLGSLGDIMKRYKEKRAASLLDKPHLPEKFLWHCFIGLCDALAYLQSGLHYTKDAVKDPNKKAKGWISILHRDIKPDNVLLRSRTTSANRKYCYVTLSDFGLACEDLPAGHPDQDYSQKNGGISGTPTWWAPELCYDPYANQFQQLSGKYPGGQRPSVKSDLWALGTVMYDLAECDAFAHVDNTHRADVPPAVAGYARCLQRNPKVIKTYYSQPLRQSILEATESNVNKRPTPTEMVQQLSRRSDRLFPDGEDDMSDKEKLPVWATRVHDYHSRTPKRAEDFKKKI